MVLFRGEHLAAVRHSISFWSDSISWPPAGAVPIGTAGIDVGEAKPPFRAAPGQPEADCQGGCYAIELPSTHSPPLLQVLRKGYNQYTSLSCCCCLDLSHLVGSSASMRQECSLHPPATSWFIEIVT